MSGNLSFVAPRTTREWKQVHRYQMGMFNHMMAYQYQPARLPYGITRLLARSTTPSLVRVQVRNTYLNGRRLTYREVEKMIKDARIYKVA
jgi:hypothetical protein